MSNIDFEYGFIELLQTKSGKARKIPLSDSLSKELNKLPQESDYVFINKLGYLIQTYIKALLQF